MEGVLAIKIASSKVREKIGSHKSPRVIGSLSPLSNEGAIFLPLLFPFPPTYSIWSSSFSSFSSSNDGWVTEGRRDGVEREREEVQTTTTPAWNWIHLRRIGIYFQRQISPKRLWHFVAFSMDETREVSWVNLRLAWDLCCHDLFHSWFPFPPSLPLPPQGVPRCT